MKAILTASAAIEAMAGLGLMVFPSAVSMLLGPSSDISYWSVVVRIAAAALLALAVSCWMARSDPRSRAAGGVVGGMLVYNAAVVGLLADARLRTGLGGGALWAAAALHTAMAVWCVGCLVNKENA